METFVPRGKIHGPILPQFILEKPITFGAKIMYALLCNYASDRDHCWPSQATLAAKLSCSVSSVKKYLAELAGLKLIRVAREQYRSCVYYLLRPALTDKTPKAACPQPIDTPIQPEIGSLNTLNKQEENISPPFPPVSVPRSLPSAFGPVGGGGFLSHDFAKAWEAYPKKEALGLARHAWNQLRQNGQLPSLSDLLTAIKRFSFTGSWQREHGRYIPQMSNFLRGQRWLDALPPEEEQAVRQRLETAQAALARKREQEAEEARHKERRELLRPVYAEFSAKFPESRNETQEAMVHGTWLFLHGKYGGLTAADVPDGNTLTIRDFMKAYQRRRDEDSCREARTARDSQVNDRRKSVSSAAMPNNSGFLARLFPLARPSCPTV